MAASSRTIIVAGAAEDLARMAALLEQQGFELHPCADGARALELGLKLQPALLLADTALPLLPAARLAQILRANPRTASVACFFVGREGEEVEGFSRHKDRFVVRPFNPEQLLADVQGYFGRRERTEEVSRQGEIAGNLSQVSLVDLLQIFGLNRKDGTLHLEREGEKGAVHLLEGRAVNARAGAVEGEKAFCRLLRWEEGRFRFTPGRPETEGRIAAPLDHLIMEGLRRHDELTAQATVLPGPETLLVLRVPRDRLPRGLRPATQEILILLEYYPRVRDLLDRCPYPDLEVLQVLRVLLEKGLVEELREESAPEEERAPLLSSEEVIAVRDRLGERDALLEAASAKILLLASRPGQVQGLVQALQGVDEFVPEGDYLLAGDRLGLGDAGRLAVAETFSLRLFVLPAAVDMGPLWAPFSRRLFGVVSCAGDGALQPAEAFFRKRGVPVARVAGAAGGEADFILCRGDRRAVRDLLTFFAARFAGAAPTEEEG